MCKQGESRFQVKKMILFTVQTLITFDVEIVKYFLGVSGPRTEKSMLLRRTMELQDTANTEKPR